MQKYLSAIKEQASEIKRNLTVLFLASKHPELPLFTKIWLAGVIAYAISPIDLIPDFIPVVGYLDDLIILPLGIWIAFKLIPENILKECREQALDSTSPKNNRTKYAAAFFIILLWLTILFLIADMVL